MNFSSIIQPTARLTQPPILGVHLIKMKNTLAKQTKGICAISPHAGILNVAWQLSILV